VVIVRRGDRASGVTIHQLGIVDAGSVCLSSVTMRYFVKPAKHVEIISSHFIILLLSKLNNTVTKIRQVVVYAKL